MRCPKCGFISFDDLSACIKCTNDLADLAEELQGTCTGTDIGFFLGSVIKATSFEPEEDMDAQTFPPLEAEELNFDDSSSDISFDLEEPEDGVISLSGMGDEEEMPGDDDIALELGEVLPIDLSQFDEPGPATTEMSVQELSLELGDDTADLDLSDTSQLNISETLDLSDNLEQIEPISLNQLGEELDVQADQLSSVDLDDIDLSDLLPEQEPVDDLELSSDAEELDLDALEEREQIEALDVSAEELPALTIDDDFALDEDEEDEQVEELEVSTDELPALVIDDDEFAQDEDEDEEQDEELEFSAEELPALSIDDELALDEDENEELELTSEGLQIDDLETEEEGDEVVDLSSLIEESGDDEISLDGDDDLDLNLLSDDTDDNLPEIQLEAGQISEDDTIPDIQLMDAADEDEIPEIELVDEDSEEPPEIPDLN